MSTFIAINNAGTTLGSSMNTTTTTMVVASGTGANFPTPSGGQIFAMTLVPQASSTGEPNEIVYVTARTGDTMTVLRAQEGTTALTWAVGDSASNLWTAGQANALVQVSQLQAQTGNYAPDTGTANAGAAALSPVPASLAVLTGSALRIKKGTAGNTAAYTLNLNGLGALPVVLPGAVALISGDLPAGSIFEVAYNGVSAFNLLSPPGINLPGGAAGGDLAGTYPNPVVAANAVTNAKLAQMASDTIKGNLGGSTTNPTDIPLATLIAAFGFFNVTQNANGTAVKIGPVTVQFGQTTPLSQSGGPGTFTLPVNFSGSPYTGGEQTSIVCNPFDAANDFTDQFISATASTITVAVQAMPNAGKPLSTAFPVNWVIWGPT